MKSLHKKISAVILAVVLVLPVLSQGFVAYADLNVKKVKVSSIDEFQNYKYVLSYEDIGRYDSLYLGSVKELGKPKNLDKLENYKKLYKALYLGMVEEYNHYKPLKNLKSVSIELKSGKRVYVPLLEYSNGKEFLKGVKNKDLDKCRILHEFGILRVGDSYFQIFFRLSPYQRQRIMVELALRESKDYNLEIKCSNRVDSIFGRAEMDDKIMKLFKDKPEVMKKLLKEPEPKYRFKDAGEFASRLKSGEIKFMKEEQRICLAGIFRVILESEQGYIRCRIGNYDYVFYYERKDKEELQKKNKEALEKFESNCNSSHNCKKI